MSSFLYQRAVNFPDTIVTSENQRLNNIGWSHPFPIGGGICFQPAYENRSISWAAFGSPFFCLGKGQNSLI
jgi:hypothetical protein